MGGGGYKVSQKGQNFDVYDEMIPDGVFELVMKDSYGDGLCCRRGSGRYTVFYGGEEVITSQLVGDQDGTPIEETTTFGFANKCSEPQPQPTSSPTSNQPLGDVPVKAAYNPAFKVPMC